MNLKEKRMKYKNDYMMLTDEQRALKNVMNVSFRNGLTCAFACVAMIASVATAINVNRLSDAWQEIATAQQETSYAVANALQANTAASEDKGMRQTEYFSSHTLAIEATQKSFQEWVAAHAEEKFVVMMEMPNCAFCDKDLAVLKEYMDANGEPSVNIYFLDVSASDMWANQDTTEEGNNSYSFVYGDNAGQLISDGQFFVTGTPTYWIYDSGEWFTAVGYGGMQEVLDRFSAN